MSHLTNGRKYAGDFTFNESGAVRHQPNTSYTYPYKTQIVFLYNYNIIT